MAKPHTQACPIAGFLNLFGDAWTLLIVREAFYGATRFSEFQRNTGIARNLLTDRLASLVEHGLFERQNIGEHGTRYAYRLTDKGRSLVPVFVAMVQWSNDHVYGEDNAPVHLIERVSQKPLHPMRPKSWSGKTLAWGDILAAPGPGATPDATARIAEAVKAADDISWTS
ncbi:MAG: helix-turn-helix domain-containing protein [Pseudomonadota bacterium]